MAGAGAGAGAALGQHGGIAVVVHHHRQSQALAHEVAEADVLEREMVAPARHARVPLDERGYSEAHGLDLRGRRTHLLDGVQEDVERLLPVGSAPEAMDPVMHHERIVHDAAEQLRAARIDPDHPPWWHGG